MARILLVTNDYPPDRGGIQSYLLGIVEHSSHAVRVIAPFNNGPDQDIGVTRHRSKKFLWPTRSTQKWVEAEAVEFGAEFILFGAPHPLAFMGPSLRRDLGIPYGVIAHGAEVAVARLIPGFSQLLKRSLAKADLVLSVSEFTKALVEKVSGRGVTRLGVGFSQPPEGRGGTQEEFVVLCVSRFVPRKQQALLIRAVEQMAASGPPVRLQLVGSGSGAGRLTRQAAASSAQVEVVDTRSREVVLKAYSEASAFAMLCKSRWFGREFEGLGIVFLEAAAAGLPVVVGRSGGAPETVLPGRGGFVTSNVGHVVEALEWLRTHPDEAKVMGNVGKSFVESEFNWRRVSARFDESIDRTLENSGPKSL